MITRRHEKPLISSGFFVPGGGITGPHESAIGLDGNVALHRFLSGEKKGFKVAEGMVRLEGVLLDIDVKSKRAVSIERIQRSL